MGQWAYDAAGDVTNDGVNMYEYDAEGRQTGVLNPTTMELTGYVYDAEGRRIEKVLVANWNTPSPQSVIQDEYLLGLNNEQVTVMDGNGNWQWTNVYAGGKQLATYDNAGTHFTLTDWLGTKRMQLSEQISGSTATAGGPFKPSFGLSGVDFRPGLRLCPRDYIHRNPVQRGLCQRPEDWAWSSFRQYATGCKGRVEIECEWTATKRERAMGRLSPPLPLSHSSQTKA